MEHPRIKIERRGVSPFIVASVLKQPEQRFGVRPGRHVFQSRVRFAGADELYLVRIVVDVERSPPEVVTVYRTSKIEKYWRSST